MADGDKQDDDTTNDDGEPTEKKGGGLKKILLFTVVALVLIGASVGGTIAVLGMLKDEEPMASEDATAEDIEPPQMPAIYYPLKPEYIVNIDARGRRRYLRLDLTVLTREDDVIAAIETHRATVDHIVTMISGGQIFEEIQTVEGKEFLRLQLLQELQAMFEKEIGKTGIEQVLFTNFVMQ